MATRMVNFTQSHRPDPSQIIHGQTSIPGNAPQIPLRHPLGPTHLNTPPTSPELDRTNVNSIGTSFTVSEGAFTVRDELIGFGRENRASPVKVDRAEGGQRDSAGSIGMGNGYTRSSPVKGGQGRTLRNAKSVPVLRYVQPPATRANVTPTKGKGKAPSVDPRDQSPRSQVQTGRKRGRTSGRIEYDASSLRMEDVLGGGDGRSVKEKDSARSFRYFGDEVRGGSPSGHPLSSGRRGSGSVSSLRKKASLQKLTSVMAAATAPLTGLTSGSDVQRTKEGSSVDQVVPLEQTAQRLLQPRRALRKMPSSIAALSASGSFHHASTPASKVTGIMDPTPRLSEGADLERDRRLKGFASPSTSDSDEIAKVDPRIVFQKERFLSRHSRDFGHLYAPFAVAAGPADATTVTPAGETSIAKEKTEQQEGPDEEGLETETERQQRLVDEARAKGREKRRSWMLNKAGIVAGSTTTSREHTGGHHRRNSSLLLTGMRSPVIGSQRIDQAGLAVTSPVGLTSPLHSVHPNRQTVMSGGPRPLSLVASRHRQLSSLSGKVINEVTLGPVQTSPIPETTVVQQTINEEEDAPRPSFTSERSAASYSSAGTTDLGHRRRVSTSRYSRNLSRRGMSLGGSGPPTAYQDHAFLTASPSGSPHASIAQAALLPPHLRNLSFSSAHSSSSLSSLGHVIASGSPASSSCSSGGSHLGGPPELPIEALNFHMSIVERPASMSGTGTRTESRATNYSSMFSTLRESAAPQSSLRTESRLTMLADEGTSPTSDTFGEEVIHSDDKGSRAVRRRARAFLVSGLKLEQGTRPPTDILIEQDDLKEDESRPDRRDPAKRAGLMIEGPFNLERPPSKLVKGPASPAPITPTQRKRYSIVRKERSDLAMGDLILRRTDEQAASHNQPMDHFLENNPAFHSRYNAQVGGSGSPRLTSIAAGSREITDTSRGVQATAGITFALFENADQGPSSPVTVAIPATPTALETRPASGHISFASRGTPPSALDNMNSMDLARELFWRPARSAGLPDGCEAAGPAHRTSLRKAKSDIGLGVAFGTGSSTGPNVCEGSAGASPGRARKSSWSGGVREWWRAPKEAQEDKAEKGFGLGRGEEHHRIAAVSLALGSSAKIQILKEKKSWTPFSGVRRSRRGSLPDVLPIAVPAAVERTPELDVDSARSRRSTEPGTAFSLNLLTPPEPVHILSMRAYRQSPGTPSYGSPPVNMMYLGSPYGTQSPLLASEPKDFRITRSPTPEVAGIAMHSVALRSEVRRPSNNRNSISESHLPLGSPALIQPLRRMRSDNALLANVSPFVPRGSEPGSRRDSDLAHGPLDGLGLRVEWTDMPNSSARENQCKTEAANDFEMHASTLVRLAHASAPYGSPLRAEFGSLGQRPHIGLKSNFRPLSDRMHSPSLAPTSSSRTSAITGALSGHVTATSVDGENETLADDQARTPPYIKQVMNSEPATVILPAKLFFFMGFLFGPWVWLMGGWGLSSTGGYWEGESSARGRENFASRLHRPNPSKKEGDKTHKWVKRNRIAAVASSAVFIPAMCVGFAYMGRLL